MQLSPSDALIVMKIIQCLGILVLILGSKANAQSCGTVNTSLREVQGCPNEGRYICVREVVQYECGNDRSGAGGASTTWEGNLFNCSMRNDIQLSHAQFDRDGSESGDCGSVTGYIFSNNSGCYRSRLMFEATAALNDSMFRCQDGSLEPIGEEQEVVIVGRPDAPQNLTVTPLSPNLTSVNVSAMCPDYGCECVDSLTIQYTSSEVNGSLNAACGEHVTLSHPALCLVNVSFTAHATISEVGSGPQTTPVTHTVDITALGPVDVMDVSSNPLSGSNVTISWSHPAVGQCSCVSYVVRINGVEETDYSVPCGQSFVEVGSDKLSNCAKNNVSIVPQSLHPSIGLLESLSDYTEFMYGHPNVKITYEVKECSSTNPKIHLTIEILPEPSGRNGALDNGDTSVFINDTEVEHFDELPTTIVISNTNKFEEFGEVNISVEYEGGDEVCAFIHEIQVPVCTDKSPPGDGDSDVQVGAIVGAVCGAFGLYVGVVSGSASNMYWILPLVAGLSGSLVVLMAVGMITSIAVFPIGIVLLIAVFCCCGEKESGNEYSDSSHHNETMAKFLFYLGIVTSIIIFPLGITAVLLYLCKYKYARCVVISFGITGSVIVFPIGLVLLFVSCCCCRGKKSDDRPPMQFQDLSNCHKALVYIGGVTSFIIFPLGIVIFVYHHCSKSDSKEKDDQEMKKLSGSSVDPESPPPTKEPPPTGPMYQDPSTIQHQPHPETGEMYAVVQESSKKKKKKKGEEPTGVMYQDPQSIEHQQAESGDMYAMPQKEAKKKKKGKKGEEHKTEEEVAQMYSTVDKNQKQKSEGLFYAELDVHSSSAKPPPPQTSEYADIQHPQ